MSKKKFKTPEEKGFMFKEAGCKRCYGIYHKDYGEKLLGWIGKNCIDRKKNEK